METGIKRRGAKAPLPEFLNSLLVIVFFDTAADAVAWIQQVADGTVVV